jgi:predicted transglutaminase-like cysteine proteinase
MLLRIAAWCSAAFLVAVPALAGIQTGAIADAPPTAIATAMPPFAIPSDAAAAARDVPSAEIEATAGNASETAGNASDKSAAPQPVAVAAVEAGNPASDQPGVQPVISSDAEPSQAEPSQKEATAPVKLAALEPPASNPPATALAPPVPRLATPGSDLPHIDASFRFNVLPVKSGGVLAKWNGVLAAMQAESEVYAHCRANMETCPKAAKKFLAIVDQGRALAGRARIGVINRAVNLSIMAVSDMAQWGVEDRWSPPLETFATGKGDCEDYAIAKYAALIETGFATADVKLMIVRNTAANEDHAVTAVRLDGAWIILDNRWLRLVEDTAMVQAVPLFALEAEGARQFLPDVLIGERRSPPAPASIAD